MRKYLAALLPLVLLGCGPMTGEEAMEQLQSRKIYKEWFYAPMHTGIQVAALDDGTSLDSYLSDKYGILQSAGLVELDIIRKSNWRNVYNVKLTEKGRELSDASRTDNEHAFVAVFRVVPETVDSLIPLEEGGTECRYTVVQEQLTPFGQFLSFEEGRRYHLVDTLSN